MNRFISVNDVKDISSLLLSARNFKQNPLLNIDKGKGKTLGLIFYNPSLRTRLSAQKAAYNLGMNVMVMNIDNDGWKLEFEEGTVMNSDRQEHIKDAAGVISQYCDIIGVRTFAGLSNREEDYAESVLTKFIRYAKVPVISLESATLHPLQSFADLITIEESKKIARPKIVLTWAPHPRALPQAVANSFVQWMMKAGYEITITHPPGYELAESYTQGATIIYNQEEALEGADFVYAKNWSAYQSYGQVLSTDKSWMITEKKMALTNQAKFMHCLPVRRNVIVSDEVIDSDNSLVLKQAHNRIFSTQAVLKEMLL